TMRDAPMPLDADIVRTGAEALTHLERLVESGAESTFYDAVVLDLRVKDLPLTGLLGELSAILPGVPMIACVSPEATTNAADALRVGVTEMAVWAPGTEANIATIVRLSVENRRAARDLERQHRQMLDLVTRDE